GGGDVQVYAAQLRWAVTDRLAIIATKDGYIDINAVRGPRDQSGFADLAAGVKYALIDNEEANFILTPGLRLEIPTGNRDVYQGRGSGEWNPFISAAKGWGNFHVVGGFGARISNDWDKKTAQLHYSLQLDYYTCKWFIPFVSANAFTVLSDAEQLPLDVEGFDLINFGSSNASGRTQVALGTGFRSRLLDNLDVGFAYEFGVTKPKGLFDDRFTVDLIYRF
ncbi:MAG: transporter, partial [Limisphaerales bacterium]